MRPVSCCLCFNSRVTRAAVHAYVFKGATVQHELGTWTTKPR